MFLEDPAEAAGEQRVLLIEEAIQRGSLPERSDAHRRSKRLEYRPERLHGDAFDVASLNPGDQRVADSGVPGQPDLTQALATTKRAQGAAEPEVSWRWLGFVDVAHVANGGGQHLSRTQLEFDQHSRTVRPCRPRRLGARHPLSGGSRPDGLRPLNCT